MTLPPGYRGRVPRENLTLKREPWPVRRLRGLRLYLGWWLQDVAADVRAMWRKG